MVLSLLVYFQYCKKHNKIIIKKISSISQIADVGISKHNKIPGGILINW